MADDGMGARGSMHERLATAADGKTYKWVAEATGSHPETVRRYMQGQSPNIEFVTAFCRVFELNPQWLLTGESPMRRAEMRGFHLAEADPTDLMAAVAATLDRLTERLDRLELFCQQIDSRLRGAVTDDQPRPAASEAEPKPGGPAGRIGRAVAKRPRADDDPAASADRT
ncbi:MAG: hypothetical protein AAGF47_01665 [Planctomycetota bacterium]